MSAVRGIYNLFNHHQLDWFTRKRVNIIFSLFDSARKIDEDLGYSSHEDPEIVKFIDQLHEIDAGGYRGADCD